MERAYTPQYPNPEERKRRAADILAAHTPIRRLWWGFWKQDRCCYPWHRGKRWPCPEAAWALKESRGDGALARRPA